MTTLPTCPACKSNYVYQDQDMLICPECAHEWMPSNTTIDSSAAPVSRDATGTPLSDGDNVTVIKDLKIKGTSSVVKMGTKVKNIRLVEGDHNIDCKIPGIGDMKLKSEFVRKLKADD